MTNYRTNAINSWHQVDVELGGVDGEQVIRGQADPDDFTERYLQTFHNSEYTGLVFNGSGSGWVPPPVIERNSNSQTCRCVPQRISRNRNAHWSDW